MAAALARRSSKLTRVNGAIPPWAWQPWQRAWTIGSTSRNQVGGRAAGAPHPDSAAAANRDGQARIPLLLSTLADNSTQSAAGDANAGGQRTYTQSARCAFSEAEW